MNRFRKFLPKTTFEIVLTVGFSLYLLGKLFHGIFFSTVDPFTLAASEQVAEWGLRSVRDIGFAISFAGMTIFGIRELRKEGFSKKKVVLPTIGSLILISTSIFCFYTSSIMKNTFENLETPKFNPDKINKFINDESISIQERSKFSKFYASSLYENEGKSIEYLTKDGGTEVYKPSEEQIQSRKESLQNIDKIKFFQRSSKKTGFLWASVFLASLFLGFFPNKRNPSNQPYRLK